MHGTTKRKDASPHVLPEEPTRSTGHIPPAADRAGRTTHGVGIQSQAPKPAFVDPRLRQTMIKAPRSDPPLIRGSHTVKGLPGQSRGHEGLDGISGWPGSSARRAFLQRLCLRARRRGMRRRKGFLTWRWPVAAGEAEKGGGERREAPGRTSPGPAPKLRSTSRNGG